MTKKPTLDGGGLLLCDDIDGRHDGVVQRVQAATIVRRSHHALAQRLKQVEGQVDSLVLAARQLDLTVSDLTRLIEQKMGDSE